MKQKKETFAESVTEILTDDELAACTEVLRGKRLYIPQKLDTKAKDLLAIPYSARVKIIENFGGMQINFPRNLRFMVGYYCGKGLTGNDIAAKLNINWSRVSIILNSTNRRKKHRHIEGGSK